MVTFEAHEAGANEQSNIMDQKLAREIHRGKVSAQIDQANAHHQLISYLHMLVEKLIARRILLTESLAYIEACGKFCSDDERIEPLRKKIEAALPE